MVAQPFRRPLRDLGPRLAGDVPANLDLEDRAWREPAEPLPLLLRDVRKLEALLEVDPLTGHLVRHQNEVVRVEESVDVGVR